MMIFYRLAHFYTNWLLWLNLSDLNQGILFPLLYELINLKREKIIKGKK